MKKILSVLLTLAMLVSAVSMLSVSASAAEVSAPANIVAQKTNPTENKQDIRFVSEIDEAILTQDVNALGYTVKATFKNTNGDVKIVNYDESACEGTKVWTSYKAETTVERPTGKYFFILTITDVPTNIGDIFLDVTAYSRVGDQKNVGEAKQFCFNNGETSTTKLIYADNFDKTPNWKLGFNRGWGSAALCEVTADNTIKIDGGWTGWQVLDNAAFNKENVYTLETDIAFVGDALGCFSIIVNSDRTFAEIDGADTMRGNCNMISFRNAGEDGKFTTTNEASMPTRTKLACSLISGTGDVGAAIVQKSNVASGSGCGFITNGENSMAKETFKLAVEVDCVNGIINMYVNGNLHASMRSGVMKSSGAVWIMAQNSLVEMDNITVKTGLLNGREHTVKAPETAPSITGESIYSEDFSGDVSALGWIKTGMTNATIDVSYENGQAKLPGAWAMSAFVDKAQMQNVTKYSTEMDVTIGNSDAGTSAIFNVILNEESKMASEMISSNRNAVIISFRACDEYGMVTNEGSKIGVSIIKLASSQTNILGTDGCKLTDLEFNKQFNLRVDVDNANKTIKVYVDSTLVLEYNTTDFTTELSSTAGPMIFWVQNTTAHVDDIKVTNTTPATN